MTGASSAPGSPRFAMDTPLTFAKYQALGNDFIVIDARARPQLVQDTGLATRLLDRQFGIGGDDLIFLTTSDLADLGMRIRTPSGGWLSICGNGIRCLGRYARDAGIWQGETLSVESAIGVRALRWLDGAEGSESIEADLLQPDLRAAAIPTTLALPAQPVLDQPLDLSLSPDWRSADSSHPILRVSCVSVGNPHAVIFEDSDPDRGLAPLARLGPLVEHHPSFPEGVNVHIARVLAPDRVQLETWERGAGPSLA